MPKSVCVITATGKQGHAVAKELLRRGHLVSTLARNISSEAAQSLHSAGATVHEGSLESREAVEKAMSGTEAVFFALPVGPVTELEYAKNVLDAAKAQGVSQVVHSSVARTGDHTNFPGWTEDYPSAWYWKQKQAVEDMVQAGGFRHWTILRPAFFMQNFCRPECDYLFPGLADSHTVRVALNPDTTMDLIDANDIGIFAANAIDSPVEYNRNFISLAGDRITLEEALRALEEVHDKKATIEYLRADEIERLEVEGRHDILSQIWQRDVGYNVDLNALKRYGVPLKNFRAMLEKAKLGW